LESASIRYALLGFSIGCALLHNHSAFKLMDMRLALLQAG
jgi:hypothetical protein